MKRPALGLRLQILLALASVMLIAYVPLFFAIAQFTRAAAVGDREDAARSLGRAVAVHIASASDVPSALASQTESDGVVAIAVYGGAERRASGGPKEELDGIRTPALPYRDGARRATSHGGRRVLDVIVAKTPAEAIVVRVRAEEDPARIGQLVRGIALYMFVFAIALLFFAYIVLTRTIVRPIEQLARVTDRIASGARRDVVFPTAGAYEVAELGRSVRTMTAKLLSDEQSLRDKVEEITATSQRLGETREQLAGSEHMASIGKLAAGVAHEIGNPIAAIMGMHDLLDDAETNDETRSDFLKRMRKETERINFVVRDLLDYARPDNEPLAASVVNEVLDDALALVRPQRSFKGITVDFTPTNSLVVAIGAQRLTQVLINLLLNAGAALKSSGTVSVRVLELPGKARIEIEDDGPGVPDELAPRIFDPFVTTKEVGAGTGLGLAVCRGIIEGAKGRIFLDPAFKRGARFVVELPLASAALAD